MFRGGPLSVTGLGPGPPSPSYIRSIVGSQYVSVSQFVCRQCLGYMCSCARKPMMYRKPTIPAALFQNTSQKVRGKVTGFV